MNKKLLNKIYHSPLNEYLEAMSDGKANIDNITIICDKNEDLIRTMATVMAYFKVSFKR